MTLLTSPVLHPYLIPLFTFLALVAAMALANIIIIWVIGSGGWSDRSVDAAIEQRISEEDSILQARANCECPCHQRRKSMMPGMRCVDCLGSLCDEGTVTAEELIGL